MILEESECGMRLTQDISFHSDTSLSFLPKPFCLCHLQRLQPCHMPPPLVAMIFKGHNGLLHIVTLHDMWIKTQVIGNTTKSEHEEIDENHTEIT